LVETPEYLVGLKRKHYKYLFTHDEELDLIEGVLDRIKDYHTNGMTLVLASSASMKNINRIFKRFDLDQYFTAKISGADLAASKPHPEIFIKAAELSGNDAKDCFVIEDSTNGIAAAKAANIYCIGYDSLHSEDQDYSKADMVVSSFEDISYGKLLQKLAIA
jgi:HAD superfamily hydrolase (TIGR01509 family)